MERLNNRLLRCLAILLLVKVSVLQGQKSSQPGTDTSVGRDLARQYCTTCHLFTEPGLLPKQSWEFLLTYMGFFLGMVDYGYLEGSSDRTLDIIRAREGFVRDANLLPAQPAISKEQWKALRDYYIVNAPETAIPQDLKPALKEDLTLFRPKPAQYRAENAITSLVHIDEGNGLILISDSRSEQLTVLDGDLQFHDRHPSPGVYLVEAHSKDNEIFLLNIGDLFASEIGKSYGELQHAKLLGGVYYNLKILLKNLHRPCDFSLADLNNDSLDELLIANFGDYTGNLSLYQRDPQTGVFHPEPKILSDQPGIVKSVVYDFSGDGLPDIAVLTSAARENLSILINKGNLEFSRHLIFEEHPSFGYTGLEMRDFNQDGLMDLITLNGDNGDSDPYNTLKRDQGIRIYLNQGKLHFKEACFYPMYGVYGVEIEDFDLDGDLDIAAIAFHPDFNSEKPENFVFLEQTGSLQFAPRTHSATYGGRWLTMDSGDLDGDGDKDIILGAAYSPVGMMENHQEKFLKLVKEGPAILVLENQIVQ